ncbi:TonB-dependent receptor plug domain-containing protein [Marinifilum sp.]|uniref:TonB-dependent receptor plug domain-containing protein n=1 Tax=Marinifilum sp. TaxID=2033137 RepID=UPI003BAA144D
MTYLKTIFSFLSISLLYFSVSAQQIEVSGKVLVYNKIPVVNADVLVNSSKQIVRTDQQGNFKCICDIKDRLIVTAKGFDKYVLKVKKNKKDKLIAKVKLSNIENAMDKAIENGHILLLDEFKELSQKNSGAIDYSRYNSVMDILTNEFPTLQISNGEVIIQGQGSISVSSAAQIEIDGFLTSYSALNNLSTTDIENIKIIKGSDASIYGVNGGNGVISITTKKK